TAGRSPPRGARGVGARARAGRSRRATHRFAVVQRGDTSCCDRDARGPRCSSQGRRAGVPEPRARSGDEGVACGEHAEASGRLDRHGRSAVPVIARGITVVLLLGALLAAGTATTGAAGEAGPFDGRWTATVTRAQLRRAGAPASLVVKLYGPYK